MSAGFWVDTNVIIRFLANDHPEHSAMARDIMKKVQEGEVILYVNPMVVAECCFVLEGKHYQYNRHTIGEKLRSFLNAKGIKSKEKPILIEALLHYELYNVDFEDAYIASYAKANDPKEILSFNHKDFMRLHAECYKPEDILGA